MLEIEERIEINEEGMDEDSASENGFEEVKVVDLDVYLSKMDP